MFLFAHNAGCESPGISGVGQKIEGGAGIGMWQEKKKHSTLKVIGGRGHPVLWGIREVIKETAALAKMAFEDSEK